MATIVNNQPPERVVEVDRDSGAGWAVALIVLIAVIVGLVWWIRYHHPAATTSGGTNINVTLPGGNTNSGSGSTGGTGGATQ